MFHADIGFVEAPTSKSFGGGMMVRPIGHCSDKLKLAVASSLLDTWGSELGINTKFDMYTFLEKHWNVAGDAVLFVLVSHAEVLLGCVAVDRKNFFPFVGNLYVVPERRREGFGARLLAFAEEYIRHDMRFDRARLWCHEPMCDYYERAGYCIESNDGSKHVMVKILNNDRHADAGHAKDDFSPYSDGQDQQYSNF